MKKITLFAAVAVLALSFASCKKDRTCECTYNGTTGFGSGSAGSFTIKSTKSKAKALCDLNNTTYQTCVVK